MKILNLIQSFATKLIPSPGKTYHVESTDRHHAFRAISPARIDRILTAADAGDTSDQCRLCIDLEEKNHDISHALQTRRNAVTACDWRLKCDDTSDIATKAIEELTQQLHNAKIADAISRMTSAILVGFNADEIVWSPGGNLLEFTPIPSHCLTFVNGFEPQLIGNQGEMITPPQGKILFIQMSRTFDPSRGGIIRPLAWLHCFSNINLKDLLAFIERYGMPFLLATLDDATQPELKRMVRQLVQNFGSAGGGMTSRAVSVEMLQAGNNGGDVYFKFLEYCEKAITKVILGQTATAGDGGGWSNDSAQSRVRQDILESDCAKISEAITNGVVKLWQAYHYPELKTPILFEIISEPPEDIQQNEMVKTTKVNNIKLAIESGALSITEDVEASIRELLELPEMTPHVKLLYKNQGGVRPHTSSMAFAETLQSDKNRAAQALIDWLSPLQKQGESLDKVSDDAFARHLEEMVSHPQFGSSGQFEALASEDVFDALQNSNEVKK